MDEFTKTLRDKKPKEDDNLPNSDKKARIMKMHAEGDDISSIRCESCNERFPANELKEKDGIYYCSNCLQKLASK